MANIFLSENEPIHRWNGNILTIAKIMKYVLSLVEKSEMGALFLTEKEMVLVRHTLAKMVWHQPPTPIQYDNSTAVRMTNYTLVTCKSKSWDLRLNWLRYREPQKQFRYYYDKGSINWGG